MTNTPKRYTALHPSEIQCLIEHVSSTEEGIIVCAGTWRGGDLMAMITAQPNKYFVVIDSFRGLSSPTKKDCSKYGRTTKGMFNVKSKKAYIQNFKEQNVRLPDEIHKMYISDKTIQKVRTQPIGMLWLDLDHYEPTRVCLEYFGKHMTEEGTILVHDYLLPITPGVRKACDEYCEGWTRQAGGIWRKQKHA